MFGRLDMCDFVLEHPTISRFHAGILLEHPTISDYISAYMSAIVENMF